MTLSESTGIRSEGRDGVDPVTLHILHNSFLSIAREMGTTMMRTSYSVIFSEGFDFSCALLDGWGDMVATANFCPVHLASMAYASNTAIKEIGIENIHEGDVIIHNDPFRGGTHITDVNIIKPIFYKGDLISFAANRAHQLDMGGKSPGSFGDATEIFQEGLRIPPVKWYDRGKEDKDIFDLILSNVRLPRVQLGDFKAQLASDITAERRVLALCEKYGPETLKAVMKEVMNYSERRMRAEIDAIPEGEYSHKDFMDNDGITLDPIPIKVTVTVKGDRIKVDFTGSSRQVAGPINAVYGVTASSTFNALLEVSDPSIPVNQGAFRPVTIIAPRGLIVNPNPPAAVQGGNTNTSIMLVSMVIGALAPAIRHRVLAASGGTCNDFICSGGSAERGDRFVYYWFPPTGWGALPKRDGWTTISDPVSNCSDTPIEIMESIYPFRYEKYQVAEDWEGAGEFRGGHGLIHQLQVVSDHVLLSATADRHIFSPYGLFGGHPAKPNAFLVKTSDAKSWTTFEKRFGLKSPSKFSGVVLHRGDSWAMITTGGGGYGNPLHRDPNAVLNDVVNGVVSRGRAESVYGVKIISRRGELRIDRLSTRRLRSRLAKSQLLKRTQILPNGVDVDIKSAKARNDTKDVKSTGSELIDKLIRENQSRIRIDYCKGTCPKHADSHLCPWHNAESMSYWGIDALNKWLSENCPLYENGELKWMRA